MGSADPPRGARPAYAWREITGLPDRSPGSGSSRVRVEGKRTPDRRARRRSLGPHTFFIRASGWKPSRRAYARREGGDSGMVVVRRRLVPRTRGGVCQNRPELVPAFARSAYARREAKREHGGSGAARLVPPVRGGKQTCTREEDRAEARPACAWRGAINIVRPADIDTHARVRAEGSSSRRREVGTASVRPTYARREAAATPGVRRSSARAGAPVEGSASAP